MALSQVYLMAMHVGGKLPDFMWESKLYRIKPLYIDFCVHLQERLDYISTAPTFVTISSPQSIRLLLLSKLNSTPQSSPQLSPHLSSIGSLLLLLTAVSSDRH